MLKKLAFAGLGVALLASPLISSADMVSDLQAQIQALMAQVAALQGQLNPTSNPAPTTPVGPTDDYGTTDTSPSCPRLNVTMQRGARDATTGGQVIDLQTFLADYYNLPEEGLVTGYFGKNTEAAVIRFQNQHSLPAFGIAGSLTRAKIASVCGGGKVLPPDTRVCPVPMRTQCPTGQHYESAGPDTIDSNGCHFANLKCVPDSSSTATFYASPMSGQAPLSVAFSAGVSNSELENYYIDFGDGATGRLQNNCSYGTGPGGCGLPSATHTYATAGEYVARLFLANTTNCESGKCDVVKASVLITVGLANTQQPSFSVSPTSGVAPHYVRFMAYGMTGSGTYLIDFGDGLTSSTFSMSLQQKGVGTMPHTYMQAGTYNARFLYQPPFSCEGVSKPYCLQLMPAQKLLGTATITVTGDPTHTLVITDVQYSPAHPHVNDLITTTVTVMNKSSSDRTKTFQVNVGGTAVDVPSLAAGTSRTVTVPNAFSFADPGQKTLHTHLIEPLGGGQGNVIDTYTNTLTFDAGSNSSGIIVISPNGGGYYTSGNPIFVQWKTVNIPTDSQMLIRLRNVNTNMEYNLVTTSNDWSESVSTSGIPVGAYNLEVKTAVNGQSYMDASDSYFKIIESTSVVSFTASPTSGAAPLTVVFTSDVKMDSTSGYLVDFGDGASGYGGNGGWAHTYGAAGTYTAKLIQTFSCTAGTGMACDPRPAQTLGTATVTVTGATDHPKFSAWPTSGTAPLTSHLTISGVSSASSYSVNFGDGSTDYNWQADTEAASTFFLSHTYQSAGTYTATLMYQPPSVPCSAPPGAACTMVMPVPVQVGTATITVTGVALNAPTCTLSGTSGANEMTGAGGFTLNWVTNNASTANLTGGAMNLNSGVPVTGNQFGQPTQMWVSQPGTYTLTVMGTYGLTPGGGLVTGSCSTTVGVPSCGANGCTSPVDPSTYPTTITGVQSSTGGSNPNLANALTALESALKALMSKLGQ